MTNIVVAITGASGSIYALRLLEVLLAAGKHVHLTVSGAAVQVLEKEVGLHVDLEHFDTAQLVPDISQLAEDQKLGSLIGSTGGSVLSSVFSDSEITSGKLTYYHHQDYSAGIASGSFLTDGMVVCPCSMGTLSSMAHGQARNLIHRAAEVHLKERRKLIVVPRETPLSTIQLDNMKRLADAGAVILPAMPGFYHEPSTIHDLIDFVVGRICDQLKIPHELARRWGDEETRQKPS